MTVSIGEAVGIHNSTTNCSTNRLTDGDGSSFSCSGCFFYKPDQLIPASSGGINCSGYSQRYGSATLSSLLPMRSYEVKHILERQKAHCMTEP